MIEATPTILNALARHAAARPIQVAITSNDGSFSWAELNEAPLVAVGRLVTKAIGQSDRVAIVAQPTCILCEVGKATLPPR